MLIQLSICHFAVLVPLLHYHLCKVRLVNCLLRSDVSFTEEDTSIFAFMRKLHINRKRTIVDRYKALACDMKKEERSTFLCIIPNSKWVNSVNMKTKPVVAKLLYHPLLSGSQVSSRFVSYASHKKCVSIPCTSSAGVVSRIRFVYA